MTYGLEICPGVTIELPADYIKEGVKRRLYSDPLKKGVFVSVPLTEDPGALGFAPRHEERDFGGVIRAATKRDPVGVKIYTQTPLHHFAVRPVTHLVIESSAFWFRTHHRSRYSVVFKLMSPSEALRVLELMKKEALGKDRRFLIATAWDANPLIELALISKKSRPIDRILKSLKRMDPGFYRSRVSARDAGVSKPS